MKIELKNLKHSVFASQETLCFDASVYVNGVKLGTVSNIGNGGATRIYLSPGTQGLMKEVEAYCKTLPPLTNIDSINPIQMDFELHIDLLVEREVHKKKLVSAMKNKIIVSTKPGEIMTVTLKKGVKLTDEIIALYQSKNPDFIVLNTLPLDEALKLFCV